MTAATGDWLLDIQRLAIHRNREALVDDASLRIGRGSLHVIVGPNGAGKSTLIAAVLGLIPFDGQIVLNWKHSELSVTSRKPFRSIPRFRSPSRISLAHATTASCLSPSLCAVASDRRAASRPRGLVRARASSAGGAVWRRTATRALAHAMDPEPELLILDEPTSGLDETAARWLEETLTTIKQGGRTAILMVSHDLDQVRRIADRVTVLDRRIVAEAPLPMFSKVRPFGISSPPEARVGGGRDGLLQLDRWLAQRGVLPAIFNIHFSFGDFSASSCSRRCSVDCHLVVTRHGLFQRGAGQASLTGSPSAFCSANR